MFFIHAHCVRTTLLCFVACSLHTNRKHLAYLLSYLFITYVIIIFIYFFATLVFWVNGDTVSATRGLYHRTKVEQRIVVHNQYLLSFSLSFWPQKRGFGNIQRTQRRSGVGRGRGNSNLELLRVFPSASRRKFRVIAPREPRSVYPDTCCSAALRSNFLFSSSRSASFTFQRATTFKENFAGCGSNARTRKG